MRSASKGIEKGVGVMRPMTTFVSTVARCQVDSVYVLTMDSAVKGTQLFQCSLCLPWQCLFNCSNGLRSDIKQY